MPPSPQDGRSTHDARLTFTNSLCPPSRYPHQTTELLCPSAGAGRRRSAAGALELGLHDEGVLRIGVVIELLDAHRLSDLALAIDVAVDDRGLRVGAMDGVDHVGAIVKVDEVDELDLEELGRVELGDDHRPALGLFLVRPDQG